MLLKTSTRERKMSDESDRCRSGSRSPYYDLFLFLLRLQSLQPPMFRCFVFIFYWLTFKNERNLYLFNLNVHCKCLSSLHTLAHIKHIYWNDNNNSFRRFEKWTKKKYKKLIQMKHLCLIVVVDVARVFFFTLQLWCLSSHAVWHNRIRMHTKTIKQCHVSSECIFIPFISTSSTRVCVYVFFLWGKCVQMNWWQTSIRHYSSELPHHSCFRLNGICRVRHAVFL